MDAYNDIFGTTAKALDLRAKRMEMISANIANADVADSVSYTHLRAHET